MVIDIAYFITWTLYLLYRRDTYVIPTANCIGYMLNTRSEQGIDPNRDFAYSRNDNTCFRSSTAKLFNVLMRETLTQIVVTFHGGMVGNFVAFICTHKYSYYTCDTSRLNGL